MPPENNESQHEKDIDRRKVAANTQSANEADLFVTQMCWLLDIDPKDLRGNATKEKIDGYRELLRHTFDGYKKKKVFNKRIRDLAWHSVLPIGGALIAWIFPSLGRFLIHLLKTALGAST